MSGVGDGAGEANGERPRVILRIVPPPPPEPPPRRPLPWRDLVFGAVLVVGLLAAGRQILLNGLADAAAQHRPTEALRLRSDHPFALARRAEQALSAAGRDPRGLAAAGRFARAALERDPMQGSAFRTLAQAAGRSGDTAAERRLMTIAGDRMKRDIQAGSWLIADRTRNGQLAEAAERADGLLRAWPVSMRPRMTAALGAVAARPGGAPTVAALLDSNPPWRSAFLLDIARNADNPGPAMALYTAMTGRRHPPNTLETDALVNRLVKDGLHQQAFLVWAQLLPAEGIRNLADPYDGGFEGLPGGPPFNWQFADQGGVLVEPTAEGEGRVLYLRFTDGTPPPALARQLLALPPGRHRLSGRWKADGISAARPLVWRFACAQRGQVMSGETAPLSGTTGWTAFETVVEVPSGCQAQWLSLTASGRGRIDGEAWFDDLKISRAG